MLTLVCVCWPVSLYAQWIKLDSEHLTGVCVPVSMDQAIKYDHSHELGTFIRAQHLVAINTSRMNTSKNITFFLQLNFYSYFKEYIINSEIETSI